ncbi:MAG TPA: MBL fold metallo-hydrolase, partial [Chitinophagales bacterium]|nr:MBL fold metallo-hydrolase [Chitinophagales bacterium]
MLQISTFTFNPFQENTYILHDQTHECIIIDPGCHTATEQQQLSDFISRKRLRPVQLINTHCHIDHVLGNRYVADTYQIELAIHKNELPLLEAVPRQAQMFGMGNIESSPAPTRRSRSASSSVPD